MNVGGRDQRRHFHEIQFYVENGWNISRRLGEDLENRNSLVESERHMATVD